MFRHPALKSICNTVFDINMFLKELKDADLTSDINQIDNHWQSEAQVTSESESDEIIPPLAAFLEHMIFMNEIDANSEISHTPTSKPDPRSLDKDETSYLEADFDESKNDEKTIASDTASTSAHSTCRSARKGKTVLQDLKVKKANKTKKTTNVKSVLPGQYYKQPVQL